MLYQYHKTKLTINLRNGDTQGTVFFEPNFRIYYDYLTDTYASINKVLWLTTSICFCKAVEFYASDLPNL